MSTHIPCFGARIRKIGIPLHTQFCYIKVGFKGVYITRACFPDEISIPVGQASVKNHPRILLLCGS